MKNFKAKLFGVSLFILTLAACNHKFDKVIPASPANNQKITGKTQKVLYIIADGARGTSVRDADIPTLKTLLPGSIYSWNSLADTGINNATNWADLITGVTRLKHNVLTEDFAGYNKAAYPTIFTRIKSVRPNMRIAAFSTSPAFKQYLTDGTDVAENLANDATLTSRMSDFLKTDTASIIVGEFSGIQAAGNTSGFDNSFAPYKAAIGTFDTEVGTLLTSISSRPNYANEDWMIVVTSNRGGAYTLPPAQNDKTIFSDASLNTFTIFYASTYKQTLISKPFVGNVYTGNSVEFLGDPQKGVGQVSKELSPFYNFGTTANFTISVKVKKHKNPVNVSRGDYYWQWPGFMGKRGGNNGDPTPQTNWEGNGGSPGWDFTWSQNRWRFMVTGTGLYSGGDELDGIEIKDENWHDLTVVCERKADNHAYISIYTDGVSGITSRLNGSVAAPYTGAYDIFNNNSSLSPDLNLDNNSVLRVGWTPGEMDGGNNGNTFGKIDVELKELKIFQSAMNSADVKQYACDQTLDATNPYYPYLIGYWPMDEGSGTVAHDKGPIGGDFTLSQSQPGGYTWNKFSDLICSPAATNLRPQVPQSADVPAQIISFFNIARQASWNLDGRVWITN
ncbi:MAG: hypothetical protein JWR50_1402 [Mucilaginibacter sp.]|nr:hypothetical protein [Mucilaginibacter sp.]